MTIPMTPPTLTIPVTGLLGLDRPAAPVIVEPEPLPTGPLPAVGDLVVHTSWDAYAEPQRERHAVLLVVHVDVETRRVRAVQLCYADDTADLPGDAVQVLTR